MKENAPSGEDRTDVIDFITTAKFQNMPDELLRKYALRDDLSDAEDQALLDELKRRNII